MERLTAQPFLTAGLLRQASQMRGQLQQQLAELTTAKVGDAGQHLSGDFRQITALDSSLSRNDAYAKVLGQLATRATAVQTGLATISSLNGALSTSILSVVSAADRQQISQFAQTAAQAFASTVAVLNSAVTGTAVFAGTATQAAALPASETILQALETVLSGVADADTARSTVQSWFADPSGYASLYQGGPPTAAIAISTQDSASLAVTALDPALTSNLAALALSALMDRGVLAGSPVEQARVLRQSAEDLLQSAGQLTDLQGRVGQMEEKIATVTARNSAESQALAVMRNALLGVDPEDTAVKLQDVETRLQSLYTLMARLSTLSLTEYLG